MNQIPMRWGKGGRSAVGIKNAGRRAGRVPVVAFVGVMYADKLGKHYLAPGKTVTMPSRRGQPVTHYVVKQSGALERVAA